MNNLTSVYSESPARRRTSRKPIRSEQPYFDAVKRNGVSTIIQLKAPVDIRRPHAYVRMILFLKIWR